MNDREVIVQTTCTILYYARAMNNSGTPLEDGEVQCLMETFRIALYPHVSIDDFRETSTEVIRMDKKLMDIMKKVVDYDGPQPEIQQ